MEETKYIQNHFELLFDKKKDEEKVRETRTLDFVINVEVKDRGKDWLNYDNWQIENYNANPIVGYQHNVYGDNMCNPPDPDDVIGQGKAFLGEHNGKRALISSVTFEPKEMNEKADKVFNKVLNGTLRAASVGIAPTGKFEYDNPKQGEWGGISDWDLRKWPGQELLEWSVVNIPMNQESVRRSLKNHTNAALLFVQNLMQDYGIKDIKQMSVQQILDIIEKKHVSPPMEQLEKELSGPDPDFEKYKLRLKQIQK
ncbi:MAG TPA: hypothetical protein VK508_01800 [Cyclobacteriaceae bacterium]|nr:hypothetical protein [Cyclobacteriaceae bacterium]